MGGLKVQHMGREQLTLPPPRPSDFKREGSESCQRLEKSNLSIMKRPEASVAKGRTINLVANYFHVAPRVPDVEFHQYSVSITNSETKSPVEDEEMKRKIMSQLYQVYSLELNRQKFAYDGDKTLYTVGPLPTTRSPQFKLVLEESYKKRESPSHDYESSPSGKRSKRSFRARSFVVELKHAARIPLRAGANYYTDDALRVLDIILRQQAANRGYLLVRQSFFQHDPRNSADVGGGALAIRGLQSSFSITQAGLSLNMDVSTTVVITPGPVIDFLLSNQNVRHPRDVDWAKAKKVLKNLRIVTTHRNMEHKIRGLSPNACNCQYFPMKVRNPNGGEQEQAQEATVLDYFRQHYQMELRYSADFPCIDVGKPSRPNYIPIELCSLLPLQRYKRALSSTQRSSLVEKSRQKPDEWLRIVTDALKDNNYDSDPLLSKCGISIDKRLTRVTGRVLDPPTLNVANERGNEEQIVPRNGRWNFNYNKLWNPMQIHCWAIVNFSSRCNTRHISEELIKCANRKGIDIGEPAQVIEEDASSRRLNPTERVERIHRQFRSDYEKHVKFILCILPERKNSDIYGPWKKKCLSDVGIATQCVSPPPNKIGDQYLTNVLLKINCKVGGINFSLEDSAHCGSSLVMGTPTMILGLDVSHGSVGYSDPSVAAVVSSRYWPSISKYRASVRTQSPKMEMIESLYQPSQDGKKDVGIMRELLMDFYYSSRAKPRHIILFRDGVGNSQFSKVLEVEVEQIKQAYRHLDNGQSDDPKFTVIVAQKNHHTKLFQVDRDQAQNIPPGTVVDTQIVHPRNYDFYVCAHAGVIGTSRPVHYHILQDEIGFSPDQIQELIHSLSYACQRSTAAVSIVAPIYYAHLAAKQMGQFTKFDDLSETSSLRGSSTIAGTPPVPELPSLHNNIKNSMFFC